MSVEEIEFYLVEFGFENIVSTDYEFKRYDLGQYKVSIEYNGIYYKLATNSGRYDTEAIDFDELLRILDLTIKNDHWSTIEFDLYKKCRDGVLTKEKRETLINKILE